MGDAANPVRPDFTSQTASVYKANIDAGFAVADRLAWAFAPHEQATPDMTVRLEAGAIFDGTTLTEVAAQNTGTITAPSANPRIDRVAIDRSTGVVSVVTGAENPSPTLPAITVGKAPVAQVALVVSQTSIMDSDITDERDLKLLGIQGIAGNGLEADSNQQIRINALHDRKTATYTAAASDRGRLLEFDSASAITLNLTAAATLGEGWFAYVKNSGAGVLTIDPNGAELVDDAATITLNQNGSTIIFCDSAAFWTVGSPGLPKPDFTSADETVSTNIRLEVAHGLAAKPTLVQVTLKNTTAEFNYSVGDELLITIFDQTAVDNGVTMFYDSTKVVIIQGNAMTILDHDTSFVSRNITVASWRWVVRAWK